MNKHDPNIEDEFMDAILREQASNRREQAIQEVENAILNDVVRHPIDQPNVDWKRLTISGSIAAAAVIGLGFVLNQFFLSRMEAGKNDVPMVYSFMVETPDAKSDDKSVRRSPREMAYRRPSAPSSSVSKLIQNSAVPSPDITLTNPPSVHFELANDFGSGWGHGNGGLKFHKAQERPGNFGNALNTDNDRVDGQFAGNERYGLLHDQPWNDPLTEPLSTFSVDVDNASYSNIRRMIRDRLTIPRDAVRIEECINAFDYAYKAPKGSQPFAVHTDLMTCPWNERNLLMKVGIKGREIANQSRPASNLVFLIDVSGSMRSPNKLPLVVESLKLLLNQLDARDSVSYVVYAGSEGVVLPPTRLNEEGRVKALNALEKLEAGGSTNGGAGLKRAYEMAEKHFVKSGVNRVILASDGDFNVGITDSRSLVDLVKERASNNIYLSVLAFGGGNLNDAMFEAISNEGNGNYFYIDGIREGRKVFLTKLTSTLVTIAKDVKLQIEFNPQRVESYRLIGYANRVLREEDFENDRVDAGDIGAGHTVTAFYEIVPARAATVRRELANQLKYQKQLGRWVGAGPKDEWLTLKLRHKRPEGEESSLQETVLRGEATPWRRASADSRFAAGVALFGMKLRGMEDVAEASWDDVIQLAEPGLHDDPQEDRAEFMGMVKDLKFRNR